MIKKNTIRNVKIIGKHNHLLKITNNSLSCTKLQIAKFNDEYKANKITIDINSDFSKKLFSSRDTVTYFKNMNIDYFIL